MQLITRLIRDLEELKRTFELLRRGLVRIGAVHSVDTSACTVVVEYAGAEVTGGPVRSLPMPWLQRSTEHRPPAAGDHALVLDPSLGNGGALAICGWPSTAKPAADDGGDVDVLFRERGGPNGDVYDAGTRTIKADAVEIDSSDIALGVNPTDYPALAQLVTAQFDTLKSAIQSAGTSPNDGGATFKAALVASLATWPGEIAAQQVKVK